MAQHSHSHSHHSHSHQCQHGHSHQFNGSRIGMAVGINLILSLALLAGAAFSHSLALAADAVHNLGDCGALMIAYMAQKIARRPADARYTYGYGRAEVLGTLLNSTLLLATGVFLIVEAARRAFLPVEIQGFFVSTLAFVALVIDLATVWLLRDSSQTSANIRAAMIHNLADAMASVMVMVSGLIIYFGGPVWVDLIATIIVSIYMIFHGWPLFKRSLLILMGAVPDEVDLEALKTAVLQIPEVHDIHHIHLWQLDETTYSLEAHIVVGQNEISSQEHIKSLIKSVLSKFAIGHSTLELECEAAPCAAPDHQ